MSPSKILPTCLAAVAPSKKSETGCMTTADTTRNVTSAPAKAPRQSPNFAARPGAFRRLQEWACSIGKPGPSIEERIAKKYLASLSPEKSAHLLSAFALLDRVHGRPGDLNAMSMAFKKEGLARLGPLVSSMTDTVKTKLAKAASDADHSASKVADTYKQMLQDIANFLKQQTELAHDSKASRILMHGMFDMLLEHETLGVDDIKNWLFKLAPDEKRALLEVENGKTSRIGRLLQEESLELGGRFAHAANQAMELLAPRSGAEASLAAGADAICAAASELQKLVEVTGHQDAQAACAALSPALEQLRGDLCDKVKLFVQKHNRAEFLAGLDTARTLRYGEALHRLGIDIEPGGSTNGLHLRLSAIQADATRNRDVAMDSAISAAKAKDFETMRQHLHSAARQNEVVRSTGNQLPGSHPKSQAEEDLAVRDWAATRVDEMFAGQRHRPEDVQQLVAALRSPDGEKFITTLLNAPDAASVSDPAASRAMNAASVTSGTPLGANTLTDREKRSVMLIAQAMRDHAEALAEGTSPTSN